MKAENAKYVTLSNGLRGLKIVSDEEPEEGDQVTASFPSGTRRTETVGMVMGQKDNSYYCTIVHRPGGHYTPKKNRKPGN